MTTSSWKQLRRTESGQVTLDALIISTGALVAGALALNSGMAGTDDAVSQVGKALLFAALFLLSNLIFLSTLPGLFTRPAEQEETNGD